MLLWCIFPGAKATISTLHLFPSTSSLLLALPASCMTLKSLPAAPSWTVTPHCPIQQQLCPPASGWEKREKQREEGLSLSFGLFPAELPVWGIMRRPFKSPLFHYCIKQRGGNSTGNRCNCTSTFVSFHSATAAGSLQLLTAHKSPGSPYELHSGVNGNKLQHWLINLTRKKVIAAHWSRQVAISFIAGLRILLLL